MTVTNDRTDDGMYSCPIALQNRPTDRLPSCGVGWLFVQLIRKVGVERGKAMKGLLAVSIRNLASTYSI